MNEQEIHQECAKMELQKSISWDSFNDAGKSILKVKAGLNRIRAFGRYDCSEINQRLGTLEDDDAFAIKTKKTNFNIKVIRDINGFPEFFMTVLINNKNIFFPQCSLEIHPRTEFSQKNLKFLLIRMNDALPNLNVSKVEYVIDQFCSNQTGVSVLFWVYRRFLHLGYHRMGNILGPDQSKEHRDRSFAYQIGRFHRVYERGKTESRQDRSWHVNDIDRVRLKHSVNRIKLKKYGINTLEDLIRNPRFLVLNLHRWRFMQFLKLRNLPEFRRTHAGKDQNSSGSTLTLEAVRSKRKDENVSEYIKNYKELVKIEYKIDRAMKYFDLEWYNYQKD